MASNVRIKSSWTHSATAPTASLGTTPLYLHSNFRGTLFWNAKCCRSFDGGVAFASTRSVRLSSQLFQFRPKQSLREHGSSKQWVEILSGGSFLENPFCFYRASILNLRLRHNYLQFSHNLNLRTSSSLQEGGCNRCYNCECFDWLKHKSPSLEILKVS